MSTTFDLYRLQKIDSQLDKVQRRLDEIQKILDDNSEMKRVRAKLDAEKAAYRQKEKALLKAETEVKKQRVKIEQTEAMLYGGSVKNPKEVQDLQNKAESLKRYLSKLEDTQIEAMLAHEEQNEKLQAAEKELSQLQAKLIQQNSRLAGEKSGLDQDKARLTQEKNAALPILEDSHLQLYRALRKKKRGIAVASILDGGCSACGATLNLSQQQKARSATEIAYCPSCQRILYGN
jgi:predicted  nucleic acid-binding Zn-ribbon protein